MVPSWRNCSTNRNGFIPWSASPKFVKDGRPEVSFCLMSGDTIPLPLSSLFLCCFIRESVRVTIYMIRAYSSLYGQGSLMAEFGEHYAIQALNRFCLDAKLVPYLLYYLSGMSLFLHNMFWRPLCTESYVENPYLIVETSQITLFDTKTARPHFLMKFNAASSLQVPSLEMI